MSSDLSRYARASVFLFGRWYVWIRLPGGTLSLRRTGLGVPGK